VLTHQQPLETFLAKDKIFTPYTLILVAAPIQPINLALIQRHASALNIPLFYFHSIGYYAHFSVQLPKTFPIVDTHPEATALDDLRILKPWPELVEFAQGKTNGVETMSAHDKGHIPYVCLLLHYVKKWKAENNGKIPEAYKDKTAVRDMIRADGADEENFEEASAAVLKSLNPPTAPSSVRAIFAADEVHNLTSTSASFWFIARAVSDFNARHGVLPLPGGLPDMKAHSKDYIALQRIYKDKARRDWAEVVVSVQQLEKSAGRDKSIIDPNEIENFCKGAAHIHLVRGRALQPIQAGADVKFEDRAKAMTAQLTNPESLLGLYIAFLAFDDFVATHSNPTVGIDGVSSLVAPGEPGADYETDATKLTGIAHKIIDNLINEAGTRIEDPEYSELKSEVENTCVEMTRAGGKELHNIASLAGGMVSQEVIKVLTAQYIPIDNCCVFDGIKSRTSVLKI
jgi:amyloid beta precursor protein binding protein 1